MFRPETSGVHIVRHTEENLQKGLLEVENNEANELGTQHKVTAK